MTTQLTTDVFIYTPGSGESKAAVTAALANPSAPVITIFPSTVQPGLTYPISGIRFNGVSQGSGMGANYQSATNYPLVCITNNATGHVFYARTHDHSFMGVASLNTVSTNFDVPQHIESGASTLVVIANGIASDPVAILVGSPCLSIR